MPTYKTPGVYVEEISKFPPSVAAVETAIPAFIGYTEKNEGSEPVSRVKSIVEYEEIFGGPPIPSADIKVTLDSENGLTSITGIDKIHLMYYTLQLYFANGGGPCYISHVGDYSGSSISESDLIDGLDEIAKYDEPTLLVFPDATGIVGSDDNDSNAKFYGVYDAALAQCEKLQDRFTVIDTRETTSGIGSITNDIAALRNTLGTANLKYGAAYYPFLKTTLSFAYDETKVVVDGGEAGLSDKKLNEAELAPASPDSLFHENNEVYHIAKGFLDAERVVLPPSGLVSGVYARVDSNRGVWKAPANESLTGIIEPMAIIDDDDQQDMNVTGTGKSVNAIRKFTGKGTLIWGARTLAGNDNEWRYVSVRRFFNFVEESVKKAVDAFVFEPNDANTWVKVKGLIDNFLILQWRAGALAGAKPDEAFFVNVGLGKTMTSQDILEGRLIVEIGMAAVRPAEFIILKFMHKMQTS